MRIRLHGTPAQIEQLLGRLGSIVDIAEVSRMYRDRAPSKLSRVYVRVDLDRRVSPPDGLQLRKVCRRACPCFRR